MPAELSPNERQLIHAAMVVDGTGQRFLPGAVLREGQRIIAVGTPAHIGRCADVCAKNYEGFVVMPALVNAHTHLDLTHIGLKPAKQDFAQWVQMIRAERAGDDESVAASVQQGVALSLAGGVAIVGDIAGVGSTAAISALRNSELRGVSYLEVFGIGARQEHGIDAMNETLGKINTDADGVRVGVQPHAPYSCGAAVYRAAAATGLPMATHLAETLEELEFVRSGTGVFRDLLRDIGVWDESITGTGKHPVESLREILSETPCAAAHVNYVDDATIELMADWPISVIYCPRASAYFGHPHGEQSAHQYQAMLSAGINVALGTDSIVCLDTAARISTLDEMRFLYRRDGTDPQLLLRMATINAMTALGMDEQLVSFHSGETAGVIAVKIDADSDVDPLVQVMNCDEMPVWV